LSQLTLEGESLEAISHKAYRWITLEEQSSFDGFLRTLGINYEKLIWCATEWEKYRCSDNPNHSTRVKYLGCGHRGICPRCSMSYASTRSNIMYQWIKLNIADKVDFDLRMNDIVLTLPEELHSIDTKLFRKMFKRFLERYGFEAYGYCIQNRHSNNPLADEYKHVHILSLNLRLLYGHVVQDRYYFDTDDMRRTWRKIIYEETGVNVEGDVNLHLEYVHVIKDKEKVKHKLAYLYRYGVQDLFNVQVREQSLNYVQNLQSDSEQKTLTPTNTILQVKELRKKVMGLFDEPKTRVIWCGLLTPSKRNKFRDLLLDSFNIPSFQWKNLKEIKQLLEKRARSCLDCEAMLEEFPIDRGKYQGDNEPVLVDSVYLSNVNRIQN